MAPSDPGRVDPANTARFEARERSRFAANCTFPGPFRAAPRGYSGLNSGGLQGRPEMIDIALRATGHVAAWLIWHSTGVSVLEDLESPRPPEPEPA